MATGPHASGPVGALTVVTWDGRSPPFGLIRQDAGADGAFLLFDYSGKAARPEGVAHFLSVATECKGQVFAAVADHVAALAEKPDYVGLIDDDIALGVSDINAMLAMARAEGFGSFSAALSPASFHAHKRFVTRSGAPYRKLAWIEVMMPFYRTDILLAGRPFFARSISSYGIDQFVMPLLHKLHGDAPAALIDAVVADHGRPITSDGKVFSNGLTAHQERRALRRLCMDWVAAERPDLLGTLWFHRTFAPLNGPGGFWPLWLAWPLNAVRARMG